MYGALSASPGAEIRMSPAQSLCQQKHSHTLAGIRAPLQALSESTVSLSLAGLLPRSLRPCDGAGASSWATSGSTAGTKF